MFVLFIGVIIREREEIFVVENYEIWNVIKCLFLDLSRNKKDKKF